MDFDAAVREAGSMSARGSQVLVAMALMAAFAAAAPKLSLGQTPEVRCGEGQGPMLDIGIGSLGFSSANLRPEGERILWRFASEPWVVSVRSGGPAEGRIERDDRIVSIDGLLITSVEGGRRWSGVGAGRTVTLVVRRGGREREVTVDASVRCQGLPWRWPARGERADRAYHLLTPTVTGDSAGQMYARALRDFRPPRDSARGFVRGQYVPGRLDSTFSRALRDFRASRDSAVGGYVRERYVPGRLDSAFARQARLARVPARFQVLYGFGIFCADCAFESDSTGAPVSWRFSTPPSVSNVEDGGPAARGGLRVGDVIEEVDGAPITSEEGARRFSEAQPGRPVRFTVRRSRTNVTVEIVPASPTPGVPVPDRARRPD